MTLDLTISRPQTDVVRRHVVGYTGPTSYATGGDAITPNNVRMGAIQAVLGGVISNGTACLIVWFNAATTKLMVFDMAGAEVSALTNLSGYTGRLEFIGQ